MLLPDYHFHRVWRISPRWLSQKEIRVLLLDIDNTLTTHDNPFVPKEVVEWIGVMNKSGVKLLLISNNTKERVAPFAKHLSLPYVADARKPLTGKIRRLCREWHLQPQEIALVGDQLFTDVLCANLAGTVSVFVDFIEQEQKPFFKVKRLLERIVYSERCRTQTKNKGGTVE